MSMSGHLLPAAAAAAVLALATSGCSHGAEVSANPSPRPTTASPSPTPNKVAIAKQEMIAAYRATLTDITEATAEGTTDSRVLGRHAIHGARSDLQQAVRAYLAAGVVPEGQPRTQVTVTSLNLDANPAFGQLRSCVDPSSVRIVDKKTGKPAPGWFTRPEVSRVVMTVWQGHWVVEGFVSTIGACT